MKAFKAIVIDVFENGRFVNRYSFNTESISLGRHPNSDIYFEDSSISRKHATLTYEGNQWFITNLGSNGTFYNGQKIDHQQVRQNDEFQIGPYRLLVKKNVTDDSDLSRISALQGTIFD